MIKDTYCANYNPQPGKRHIFSPPFRSHQQKHLLTKAETGQPHLAVPLRQPESDLNWRRWGSAWLKPTRFTSKSEVWQGNIRQRYRWLYSKPVGRQEDTTELHRISEQVMIYQAVFKLQWFFFNSCFLLLCMRHVDMEHTWGWTYTHVHAFKTPTQTHTSVAQPTELWSQSDKHCWNNTYIVVYKTHTRIPEPHCMMSSPCVWPSATLLLFLRLLV